MSYKYHLIEVVKSPHQAPKRYFVQYAMKIGYIKPSFPCEKRVGLLPEHLTLCNNEDERRFERGFGANLGIDDASYGIAGGFSRENLFAWADIIYSLKVPQPSDYEHFRRNQGLVGWTHPLGSGMDFIENCAQVKDLTVFDITNRISMRYQSNNWKQLTIPSDITRKNSILAGYASTMHAIMLRGGIRKQDKVAVFGTGNVALGAIKYLNSRDIDPILRRRSNAYLLQDEFSAYDIFINCVEIDAQDPPIINQATLNLMRPGGWIIDAAADAGRAIEQTQYTSIVEPTYMDGKGRTFYVVNNSPALLYRESSAAISEGYSTYFWSQPMSYWYSDKCLTISVPTTYRTQDE